ncbi:MAG: hypothetical protein QG635_2033 [Bacteroidota bacterium]|nr:hypothetical protein [Bacteroidota bacterium]
MILNRIAVLLCLFMMIGSIPGFAISKLPGQWSLLISGNVLMNYGISESMRGSLDDFYKEFETNYQNSKYPFADDNVFTGNFGGQLAYRFPESDISIYFALTGTYFSSPKYSYFNGTNKVVMLVTNYTPGIEYCFGTPDDIWNVFGRLGLCFSNIVGSVYYLSQDINLSYAFRIGYEAEAGGRLNIPHTPLSFEMSVNYTNANLFLKKYTEPNRTPPQVIIDRELNDGEGGSPKQNAKTIDFLSFKIGVRLWF